MAGTEQRAIAIHGGRLLDPATGLDETASLYLDAGVIAGIGAAPAGFSAEVSLQVDGQVVCPGLVDLRARLVPGPDSKTDIASEMQSAIAGGVTTLACMPDSWPPLDIPASVSLLAEETRQRGLGRVIPLGALTRKMAGQQLSEMASLKKAGCSLLTNPGVQLDSLIMRRAMEYARTFGLDIITFSEDRNLAGTGCVHEGSIGLGLGLQTIPTAAEEIGISRDLALAELTGCRIHFGAVSSARGVELIRAAKERGCRVTADVGIHQLLLNDQDVRKYGTLCHLRPPLRDETDRRALIEAVHSGVIDAICSDHLPHDTDAKLTPFPVSAPGAAGFELLLALAWKLAHDSGWDARLLISRLTREPSAILKLPPPGIGIGKIADLTVFDPHRQWVPAGSDWISRGVNSPFWGQPLTGRVTHTLVGGRLVYRLDEQGAGFPSGA